jgi:hypothetical protein
VDAPGPAPPIPSGAHDPLRVGIPGKPWRLVLDLPGHRMAPPRLEEDGSFLVTLGEYGDTGIAVSVVLERLAEPRSARDCREHYRRLTRRRSPVTRAGLEALPHPEATVVRYTMEGSQDGAFHQKHVNAYLRHDGYCIDVHLSKEAGPIKDERLLEEAVRTIRLERRSESPVMPPPSPDATWPDGARQREAIAGPPALRSFGIPDRPLALILDARGVVMEVSKPRTAFDIRRRRYRGQTVTGWSWWGQRLADRVDLLVFARLEHEERNARAWRDRLWPEIDLTLLSRPEGVTRGERDGVAWIDYARPWRQRARIDARSRHLFLTQGDVVATAHLEIVDPRPEDEAAFAAFLAAARFEARGAPPGPRPAAPRPAAPQPEAPSGTGPPTRR